MVDVASAARVKRQRELRVAEGWQEVTVWVPTSADAEEVRNLAAERRAKAEALHGLSDEVRTVTPDIQEKVALAIAQHGSAAYVYDDGAVLDLLTELAEAEDFEGFSKAFTIFARAKPVYAPAIASFVPAKILNALFKRRRLSARAFEDWRVENTDWAESLKAVVRSPVLFARLVESISSELEGASPKH